MSRFLTHLAVDEHVSASAQIRARAALVFLCRYVLNHPLGRLGDVVRAKRPVAARPSGARQAPHREELLTAKPAPRI